MTKTGTKKRKSADERTQLRDRVIGLLGSSDYAALPFDDLCRELQIADAEEKELEKVLAELIEEGLVVHLRRKGYALTKDANLMVARLSFVASGNAFAEGSNPAGSVFIPANATGTGLHGDKVLVRMKPKPKKKQGGDLPEGEVARVLERRKRIVAGVLNRRRRFYYVQPMQKQFVQDILVPDPGEAQIGDRVVVRLSEWDDPSLNPEGDIIEVIGPAEDPSLDTIAVMKNYELPDEFPESVLENAQTVDMGEQDFQGRWDLRDRFTFTIDPASARDYDDAISLEKTKAGLWRLGVHIADVSHFVRPGSELDVEAKNRATSVYLPDRVIPMLPEQLSNGLCSLRPDADRLAFSVMMSIDEQGQVKRVEFKESVIRSRLRLTYEQALKALQMSEPQGMPEEGISKKVVAKLQDAHRLAERLRRKREEEGALMMDVPEVTFRVGEDGRIADVEPVRHDISHQLIEEFMLVANESVCKYLAKRDIVQLHRVHPAPDQDSLAALEQMFRVAGLHTEDFHDRRNLARLLTAVKDMPAAPAWYTRVVRSMQRAEYSTEAIGHYGLAKDYYAHFTSPIRRYPDLVTHRLLKAVLAGESIMYSEAELEEVAEHCSEREQIASEAEREVIQLKVIRFFAEQLESGQPRVYESIVVDVRPKGVFVELPDLQATGLIHVSELDMDFFDFDPESLKLQGRRTGAVLTIGMSLNVHISRVDQARKRLDFAPSEPEELIPSQKSGKPKKSGRKGRRKKKRR